VLVRSNMAYLPAGDTARNRCGGEGARRDLAPPPEAVLGRRWWLFCPRHASAGPHRREFYVRLPPARQHLLRRTAAGTTPRVPRFSTGNFPDP